MTQPRIHLTETAVTDMENIVTWYVEQGAPDVGRRLVTEIMQRIETLAAHPEIGRVVPEFNQPQVRELIHPPFRVVYRYAQKPSRAEIQVIRIWRSERLLPVEDAGNNNN
jgi:plasmid stabilization system protein ParE